MNRPQTEAVRAAREKLGLSMLDVWLGYISMGGSLPPATIEMFLLDRRDLDDHNFDLVVQAINEQFLDRNENHPLAYSNDLPPAYPGV